MAAVLQHRQVTSTARLALTPSVAELLYDTSTKKVFAGDGSTLGGIAADASPVTTSSSATYTVLQGDVGKTVIYTGSANVAITLPQAGSSAGAFFPATSAIWIINQTSASHTVTITPTTSTINGAASLVLNSTDSVRILSDGTNYWAVKCTSSAATTLAGLTDVVITSPANGELLTYNSGTGKWNNVAPSGGSGALILVSTQSGSSADFHWTGLATFETYRISGRILPVTDNVDFTLTFGTGGGPTYISSGYFYGINLVGSGGFVTSLNGESAASIPFASGVDNAVGISIDWEIQTDNATFVMVTGTFTIRSNDTHTYSARIGAGVALAAPLTAIKLITSSGNINGKLSLFSLGQ